MSAADVPRVSELADEAAAWLLFERLRWNGAPPSCPHCGVHGRCFHLRAGAGVRVTRTGAATARRVWKCGACRRQFSVLTGTVLEGTRLPLTTWIDAVDRFVHDRGDVPAEAASSASRRRVRHLLTRALGDV